ncbi:helix-turn-helix transcriptional regulator [Aerococcaceae bacterium zg-ZUI334]|uniref:helix-turn-helix transcriptional regulator n=1 Tax=Aerococcaceae TaxID=186827 RepID=UPI0013B85A12|nr:MULTISPECIES: AraC family transcriptional regulator [unclassified Facklamia]MBR7927575.1 helix-turn-helix transcriptional regulator [Aerococcaceae bacterium zg-ZUI334]MBS4462126.1 helix-turn-helix transcriptional regulator [Aerococcaceae bacterium zg-B36]QQD65399.1 helix-turn-helix transcriptional regulator [Aerococcaceae bacterium zg-252]NEW64586.1 helix-turn-helix domain-containing protein [Facklamia sp. 252]NEW67911.1 helix-turn-helix domain-containing protein [Facklamia sp. 253]
MLSTLFSKLISNLLKVTVYKIEDENILQNISTQYQSTHYSRSMFHVSSLKYLISHVPEYSFTEFIDELNVCILFFYFASELYMIGPYMKVSPDRKQIEEFLIKNKLPASFSISMENYLSNIPILSSYRITDTLNSIINSFNSEYPSFNFVRFEYNNNKKNSYQKNFAKGNIDYTNIYQRYELENQLMLMIESGDINAVQHAFKDVTNFSKNIFDKINSTYAYNYYNVYTANAMIRVLARKAAEKSGLSVIIIDQITQKNIQNLKFNSTQESLTTLITELTQAVHDYLIHKKDYNPIISNITEFLMFHYSEEISLTALANKFNVSDSYLSKLFIKETGETIKQYIAKLRCKKAADLLIETNMKISQISEFVGYLDNNYFIKVFKKLYNQTPSEYRKKRTQT